jgi:hypothetical protein
MPVSLKRAHQEMLADLPDDLPSERRDLCGEAQLGFEDGGPDVQLDFQEPVFSARRGGMFVRHPRAAGSMG